MNDVHDPSRRLGSIDLNLLVALDMLLRLRSVTQAAKNLGITQSAMSHSLRRLRDVFDDPLLVRGTAGMVPTPRAEALADPLRGALLSLCRAIEGPPDFEPATTERGFALASPDLFDALVLPRVLTRLAELAPRITLTVAPGLHSLPDRLESGELDLAVVATLTGPDAKPMAAELSPELRMRRLLRDRFKAFVRRGHPALGGRRLSAKAFAKLGHVLVSPTGRGEGVVEPLLAERGLKRRIAFRAPHFATAIAVTQETDLVLVAPGALELRAARLGLRELPVALELPRHAVNMVWHARLDADPGHAWLREQLVGSVEGLVSS